VIKGIFASKRIRGEWFALSEEDVTNLLDKEWRRRNSLFLKKISMVWYGNFRIEDLKFRPEAIIDRRKTQ